MPRPPKDLRGLLEHIGLKYIRERGDEVWAGCPSHHDSGDSWSINRRTGMHSCFACGHAGTLQMLVMDEVGCDNFAANRLIRSYGVEDILDYLEEAERQRSQLIEEPEDESPFRPPPMSMAVKFSLFTDPPDQALAKRKISRESAEAYGLRWKAPKAWVLPIRSPGGQLMGWEEKGPQFVLDRPRGVNTSETVFGAERLRHCERAVLLESPLDACLLHTLGIEHAFASFGAVVSDAQIRLLCEYTDEILLALDNDKAGRENMARIISGVRYAKNGKRVRSTEWQAHKKISVISYDKSDGKDVGEMSEDRIRQALGEPIPAHLWVQGVARDHYEFFRAVAGLPRGGRRPNGGGKPLTGRLRDGAGKDGRDHRRSGATDRRR